MSVQRETLLDVATRVLLSQPQASLTDVAKAAGMSRTTLHSRFATREALLVALAHEALDLVEEVYADAGIVAGTGTHAGTGDHDGELDVAAVLHGLVERAVPIGPRVAYLLRERSLDADPELTERYLSVDRPLVAFLQRAQSAGRVRADQPAWWLAAVLLSGVAAAWESIDDGRLAARDAPGLVTGAFLDGARPR